MTKDPRSNNELPSANSPAAYVSAYSRALQEALSKVSLEQLDEAYAAIAGALKNGARVYLAGNGGSAAIADHFCCDLMKGTHVPGKEGLKVYSMTSSTPLLTAIANDFGYDRSIAMQIEMLGEKDDVVILVSSSGNSPNIVKAIESARKKGLKIIGLSGFSGGKLAAMSDFPVYVPIHNYGMAEDAHQAILHAFSQFLARERDSER